ncbi:MAG TPA: GlsB/YeaQ/YmgE family stress response membrane protein [Holophagaceae bacterium]|nr:GlsB/YeaQ/YmgE family stress response membrane protein [Holophagaceae bacterium]
MPLLHLFWTCLIGLVVGAVAKLLVPGKDPGGWIITAALGIAGSFVGTFLGRFVHLYGSGESAGVFMSIVGAMILLGPYHFLRRTPA